MSATRRHCIAAIVCALVGWPPSTVDAQAQPSQQEQLEDVLYLKDGGIVRGTIIERRPGESVLIRTRDGNQFRYRLDQIERLARERSPYSPDGVPRRGRRDPAAAGVLSAVIIGGGQAYNGEWGKAGLFLGGAVLFGSAWLSASDSEECLLDNECDKAAPFAVLWVGTAVWNVVDAVYSAKRINRESGLAAAIDLVPRLQYLARTPGVPMAMSSGGVAFARSTPSIGLSLVRLRW